MTLLCYITPGLLMSVFLYWLNNGKVSARSRRRWDETDTLAVVLIWPLLLPWFLFCILLPHAVKALGNYLLQLEQKGKKK